MNQTVLIFLILGALAVWCLMNSVLSGLGRRKQKKENRHNTESHRALTKNQLILNSLWRTVLSRTTQEEKTIERIRVVVNQDLQHLLSESPVVKDLSGQVEKLKNEVKEKVQEIRDLSENLEEANKLIVQLKEELEFNQKK